MNELTHGIPEHPYFAIFQPIYKQGGLDCSCRAQGVGMRWTFKNPHTGRLDYATLVLRRTLYTDSDIFDAVCLIVYGVSASKVMTLFQGRYPGMVDEKVEMWLFKKE